MEVQKVKQWLLSKNTQFEIGFHKTNFAQLARRLKDGAIFKIGKTPNGRFTIVAFHSDHINITVLFTAKYVTEEDRKMPFIHEINSISSLHAQTMDKREFVPGYAVVPGRIAIG